MMYARVPLFSDAVRCGTLVPLGSNGTFSGHLHAAHVFAACSACSLPAYVPRLWETVFDNACRKVPALRPSTTREFSPRRQHTPPEKASSFRQGPCRSRSPFVPTRCTVTPRPGTPSRARQRRCLKSSPTPGSSEDKLPPYAAPSFRASNGLPAKSILPFSLPPLPQRAALLSAPHYSKAFFSAEKISSAAASRKLPVVHSPHPYSCLFVATRGCTPLGFRTFRRAFLPAVPHAGFPPFSGPSFCPFYERKALSVARAALPLLPAEQQLGHCSSFFLEKMAGNPYFFFNSLRRLSSGA